MIVSVIFICHHHNVFFVHCHYITQVRSVYLFLKYSQCKQSSKYIGRESFEDIIKKIGDITSDKNSKPITGRFLQESLLFNNADVIQTLLILNVVNFK